MAKLNDDVISILVIFGVLIFIWFYVEFCGRVGYGGCRYALRSYKEECCPSAIPPTPLLTQPLTQSSETPILHIYNN